MHISSYQSLITDKKRNNIRYILLIKLFYTLLTLFHKKHDSNIGKHQPIQKGKLNHVSRAGFHHFCSILKIFVPFLKMIDKITN